MNKPAEFTLSPAFYARTTLIGDFGALSAPRGVDLVVVVEHAAVGQGDVGDEMVRADDPVAPENRRPAR